MRMLAATVLTAGLLVLPAGRAPAQVLLPGANPPPGAAAPAPAAKPPANAAAQTDFTLPPLDQLEATRDRPLFSPSRRPDAAPVATAEPEEDEKEDPEIEESAELPFELTGVVMGPELAVAILQDKNTKESVHLREGEALNEWTIAEITARNVVVKTDTRRVRLQLFEEKPDADKDKDKSDTPKPPTPRAMIMPPRTNLPPGMRVPGRVQQGGPGRRLPGQPPGRADPRQPIR